MRRRKFLKGLFGAALVPVVGKAALNERTLEQVCDDLRNDGVSLQCIAHPHLPAGNACVEDMVSNVGFGLSPVKREGETCELDPRPGRVFSGTYRMDHPIIAPRCDCADGPHGTACSNRNVLRRM